MQRRTQNSPTHQLQENCSSASYPTQIFNEMQQQYIMCS